MANIKSQIKRIRTNERRRVRNKSVRSAVRTYIKGFYRELGAGDREAAARAMRSAARELDRAVSKRVIHRNGAANRKSAMARDFNSAAGAQS
ncbi:MAG: 30S ribosomal protein S20 [Actinomycetota bacterium]